MPRSSLSTTDFSGAPGSARSTASRASAGKTPMMTARARLEGGADLLLDGGGQLVAGEVADDSAGGRAHRDGPEHRWGEHARRARRRHRPTRRRAGPGGCRCPSAVARRRRPCRRGSSPGCSAPWPPPSSASARNSRLGDVDVRVAGDDQHLGVTHAVLPSGPQASRGGEPSVRSSPRWFGRHPREPLRLSLRRRSRGFGECRDPSMPRLLNDGHPPDRVRWLRGQASPGSAPAQTQRGAPAE